MYRNCFWHSEQFLYTTCSPHVLQKEELLTRIYLYSKFLIKFLIGRNIIWIHTWNLQSGLFSFIACYFFVVCKFNLKWRHLGKSTIVGNITGRNHKSNEKWRATSSSPTKKCHFENLQTQPRKKQAINFCLNKTALYLTFTSFYQLNV